MLQGLRDAKYDSQTVAFVGPPVCSACVEKHAATSFIQFLYIVSNCVRVITWHAVSIAARLLRHV